MTERSNKLSGRLAQTTPFGRFVDLDDGRSGVITVATTEAGGWSGTGALGRGGARIHVRVVGEFTERGQRRLRLAPVEPGPNEVRDIDSLIDSLEEGQQRTGVLRNWDRSNRTRFVDLGYGLDGIIRRSALEEAGFDDARELGDSDTPIQVRVTRLDRARNPIGIELAPLRLPAEAFPPVAPEPGTTVYVLDGSNAAVHDEIARFERLMAVRHALESRDPAARVYVWVDASLPKRLIAEGDMTGAGSLDAALGKLDISAAPPGTDADWFLLTHARSLSKAIVVTRDSFADHPPELLEGLRTLGFRWDGDRVVLDDRVRCFKSKVGWNVAPLD